MMYFQYYEYFDTAKHLLNKRSITSLFCHILWNKTQFLRLMY
uniref:Uncharacterized protein n=1 Tax=Anguilla anguilla TaxID=7936 RepID=A0A0E9XLY5_ANGAN